MKYTLEDLKKAFAAGIELSNYEWHVNEFCGFSCKHIPLSYNDFDDWYNQNFVDEYNAE